MKLRHTIFTMSVRRYAIMQATGNKKMACMVVLPFLNCKRQYNALIEDVARLFGGTDLFDDNKLLLIYFNKMLLLQSSRLILDYEPENEAILEWYKSYFHRPFTGKFSDLDIAIATYKNRYERIIDKSKSSEGMDIDTVISGVEVALEHSIDRNIRLFELKNLLDIVIKKSKK